MAHRIVIEHVCHICGQFEEHDLWCSARGVKRRVFTEGEVKAHVADALLFDGWTCDFHEPDPDCSICQRQYEKTAQHILDALVGGNREP